MTGVVNRLLQCWILSKTLNPRSPVQQNRHLPVTCFFSNTGSDCAVVSWHSCKINQINRNTLKWCRRTGWGRVHCALRSVLWRQSCLLLPLPQPFPQPLSKPFIPQGKGMGPQPFPPQPWGHIHTFICCAWFPAAPNNWICLAAGPFSSWERQGYGWKHMAFRESGLKPASRIPICTT